MILKTEITPDILSKLSTQFDINYLVVPTKKLLFEMLNDKQIQDWYDMQTHHEISNGIIGTILGMSVVLKKTASSYCEAYTDTQKIDTYENVDNIKKIADEVSSYLLMICNLTNESKLNELWIKN